MPSQWIANSPFGFRLVLSHYTGSMVHARLLALPLIALLALPAAGQPRGHDPDPPRAEDLAPEFHDMESPARHVLPLKRAFHIVAQRFRGRLIAARLVPPFPRERQRGTALVHQLRLLTPSRDVLVIRLDAQTGAFLDVAGAGLSEARRKRNDR